MTDDGALFDFPAAILAGPPVSLPEPMSADRRRTLRQAETVAAGGHPLTLAITRVQRHPDTRGQEYSRDDPPGRDLTCGTCEYRTLEQGGANAYPKCYAEARTRVTNGPGTDIRKWWPACTLWMPVVPT